MEKVTFRAFLFLLVFSPLAFGAVEKWSLTLVQALSFLTFGLYVLTRLIKKKPIYQAPGLLPLMLFLCFLLFQLVPLPPAILKLLSPQSYDIYQQTLGIIEPSAWLSISIHKKATLEEFFRYASYVSFYYLAIQLLADKKKLQKTVYVIVIFASLLVFFSLIQHFTSINTIYWLREISGNVVIFGPYLNHNHFAGLMEMIFPIALALFLYLKPRIKYEISLREKIVEVFDPQGSNVYLLLGFASVLIVTSIVISLSRGAMISICLAMILFVILLILRSKRKKNGIVLVLFLVLVVLSISWFGWDDVFQRFGKLTTERGTIHEARFVFWKDSVNIIKDFPVTGTGFGTFANIYPRYRTYTSPLSVLHAHNDYLELLIEGGLIGFALVTWFLLVVLMKTLRVYRQRRERFSLYLYLGCLTGISSLLFHSLTDFNMHIGANGLYYFFMIGLLVSAANTKFRGDPAESLLKKSASIRLKLLTFSITTAMLTTGVAFNAGILLGDLYFSSAEKIYLNPQIPRHKLVDIGKTVQNASAFDPLESKYYYASANMDMLLLKRSSALINYRKAIYFSPLNSEILQRFGLVLSWYDNLKTAEQFLEAGINNDISNSERYKTYADWLFSINKKTMAAEYLKKALFLEPALNPKGIKEYIITMLINDLHEDQMVKVMEQRAGSLIGLADYWNGAGNKLKAEETYLSALNQLDNGDTLRIDKFINIINFYNQQGKLNDALKVSLKAVEHLPDSDLARVWAARMYVKLGVTYRAVEEYKTALTINPDNKQAQKELSRIDGK